MARTARVGNVPQLAKYEVLEEIGHGGMATVYRARDRRLGREVALKVIHPHLRDSKEVVSRFNVEARAVAKLRHPNIVTAYQAARIGENIVFAATGISHSPLLKGVKVEGQIATTHSVVMRARSGTVRFITAHHNLERKTIHLRSTQIERKI